MERAVVLHKSVSRVLEWIERSASIKFVGEFWSSR